VATRSARRIGLGGNNALLETVDLRYGPREVIWRRQQVGNRVDLPTDVHREHVGTIVGQPSPPTWLVA
jgi:hypothetical protein